MARTIALLLGNFLEFYDFTLFAYLIPIISPLLFPSQGIVQSLTFGYVFLAIGFFARPLGAFLFGYIGDNYGRKRAIVIAILMMSVSTLIISITPTSDSIGVYVCIILAFCRILQGLSAGGEYSGAGLLLIENTAGQRQFLNGAILTASALSGAFVASLVSATVSLSIFPQESWRILFFIGGVIGGITLWFRITIKEDVVTSPVSTNLASWGILFKEYKAPLFYTIIFGALMNVPFQMTTGFINTYFVATGAYSKTNLMFINAFIVLFCAIITVCFGLLSKFIDPMKTMVFASLGMVLFSFPFFFMVVQPSVYSFIFAQLILIMLSQLFVAPAFTVITKLFPYQIRYRGVAIGNSLGLAFLGGGTPYVSALLIQYTGISWSPACYLFVISLLGFAATLMVKNKLENNLSLKLGLAT